MWALGPETLGGRALATAEAPNLTLPDLDGNEFELASLRGNKVLLVAWSPY
jgi:peroxiredoxin